MYIYIHLYTSIYIYISVYVYKYGQGQNYRMEVEEYEGTFIYRTLLFHNSVFLGKYEKKLILTYSYSFRRSIILVCSIIVFSPLFATFISFVL